MAGIGALLNRRHICPLLARMAGPVKRDLTSSTSTALIKTLKGTTTSPTAILRQSRLSALPVTLSGCSVDAGIILPTFPPAQPPASRGSTMRAGTQTIPSHSFSANDAPSSQRDKRSGSNANPKERQGHTLTYTEG